MSSSIFKKYRHLLLLAIYPLFTLWYFLLNQSDRPIHMISCPLDYRLPFCEWFILPYVGWYIYVFIALILTARQSPKAFVRLCLLLYSGMAVAQLLQTVYPTGIDFRPTSFERDNFLTWIVGIIYASDAPVNVFPSIHCYNALAAHLACYCRLPGATRLHKALSLLFVILVFLSTVLIKQHSVLDAVGAILLMAILYPLLFCVPWRRLLGRKEEE